MTRQQAIARIQAIKNEAEPLKAGGLDTLERSTFKRLHNIFNTTAIKPEAAPFVIGRMYEAFADYVEAQAVVEKYDKLVEELRKLDKEEQTQKNPATHEE